uniref:Uncharacterized protein n=1 Tax=Acanthochromis polyacanthus TaxID=80966 RepID=A0A3Q1EVM5_9TELE
LLVPAAWQPMTPVALSVSDWEIFNPVYRKVRSHSGHYNAVMQQPLLTNQMPALSAHQPINIGIAHVVWPQPANKRNRHGHNRNLSHTSNVHISACRTPKMADVVGQALAGQEEPRRTAPLVETRRPEVRNTDEEEEEDGEEEVSCFKDVVPSGSLSRQQQQRDVAVLMGDTPSPAASVISIRSDLTEDEREDEDPQRCRLNE